MIQVATYNTLRIDRFVEIGAYLDDGAEGILLPRRFVPENAGIGDMLEVFIYHDGEDRLIATTQRPYAKLGEIAYLKVVGTNNQGAFMDWGLMKDIFVPRSQQRELLYKDAWYFVKIYIDEKTGRAAATQKIDSLLQNDPLTVTQLDPVHILVYRESDLGYVCIVNHRHEGLIHYADVFKKLYIGDSLEGFVKKIYPETNKLDIVPGKRGYEKVEGETEKILRLLAEHNGFLPFHDKSEPEAVYDFFGMSKKVFKMTTGNLFKQHKIVFTKSGIRLLKSPDEAG